MLSADSRLPEGTSGFSSDRELGYDAEEQSDCTFPSELDLRDKIPLLRWKYLEGGHRLPLYIPKIPHVDETKVISTVLDDEFKYLEVGKQIAGTAKQIQTEYIYAKQRFDLLQQEKDLLKWHLASNSKVMKLKEGKLHSMEARTNHLKHKLETVRLETEKIDRERSALSFSYHESEAELNELLQEYDDTRQEMEQWLHRRGDYLADMTLERRKAGHERRLRYRQWKKLARACAVDKKWHVRIEATKNADAMIFDAFEATNKLLDVDFEKAADVTGPIRDAITEQIARENPFEGVSFSSSRGTNPSAII